MYLFWYSAVSELFLKQFLNTSVWAWAKDQFFKDTL